jgi:uncharacterized membrane protein YtjA (UPF0391 family)
LVGNGFVRDDGHSWDPATAGLDVCGGYTNKDRIVGLLGWALIFLIVAAIAAVFGFGGIASVAAGIAKVLFFIFIVVFVVLLILGLLGVGMVAA